MEQYINIEDIPKKYGGTLDWEWGQLPNLDPEIAAHLKWEHPSRNEHGQDSFPKGPVRWRAALEGDAAVVALGSENGRQRQTTVATLKRQAGEPEPEMNRISSGIPIPLPSTSGEHTHPTDLQEFFPRSGQTPPESEKSLPIRENTDSPAPSGLVDAPPAPLPVGTGAEMAETPSNATTESQRTGTSATRMTQQNWTHAAEQLAEGTPAVVDHGAGDKTATMEPGTVGQAPKEVSTPARKGEEAERQSQGGYLDSAKEAASSAVGALQSAGGSVMAAAGLGGVAGAKEEKGKEELSEEELAEKKAEEDRARRVNPAVDRMGSVKVEEFIRSKYASANKVGARDVDHMRDDQE